MIHTELIYGEEEHAISVDSSRGTASVKIGDETLEGEVLRLTPNALSIRLGNRRRTAFIARSDEKIFVHVGGQLFEFTEAGAERHGFAGGAGVTGDGSVSSPMPGRVVKIPVAEGQEVEKNQILVIVEAMKMENPLKSSVAGTVSKIHFSEGDLVDAGKPIVEVEPSED